MKVRRARWHRDAVSAASTIAWRLRFVWFASIVMLPTLPAPLLDDDAHALYTDAATFRGSVGEAISYTARETSVLASKGNFRPIGRLFGEHLPHMFSWETAVHAGVTPPTAYTIARFLAAVVLAWSCSLAVWASARWGAAGKDPGDAGQPSRLAQLVGLGFLALLIAPYAKASSSLSFAPIYLTTTSLAILAVVAIIRRSDSRCDRSPRVLTALRLLGMGAAGWVISWWNELAFAAATMATLLVAVVAFRRRDSSIMRYSAACGVGLITGMVWARFAIANAGEWPGGRYDATSVAVSWSSAPVFLNRVVASSPVGALLELWTLQPLLFALAAAAICLAACALIIGSKPSESPRAADRRIIVALGIALIAAAAAIPAVSAAWQHSSYLSFGSWRETVTGRVGWALLITAGVQRIYDERTFVAVRWRTGASWVAMLLCSLVVAVGAARTATSLANIPVEADMIRAGELLMELPGSPDERERCAVSGAISSEARTFHERQTPIALEQVAVAEWGRRFCSTVPVPG